MHIPATGERIFYTSSQQGQDERFCSWDSRNFRLLFSGIFVKQVCCFDVCLFHHAFTF